MNDAFVEMAKDMLIEAKRQNKRLFCALIILICIMFAMIVAFFVWFNSVDTSVTTTTIEQAADTGNLSIQINSNGALIPGTVQVANSTAVTDIVNLTTSTIVDIPRSCACINNDAVITIVNSGIAGTFVNGSVQIVKLA